MHNLWMLITWGVSLWRNASGIMVCTWFPVPSANKEGPVNKNEEATGAHVWSSVGIQECPEGYQWFIMEGEREHTQRTNQFICSFTSFWLEWNALKAPFYVDNVLCQWLQRVHKRQYSFHHWPKEQGPMDICMTLSIAKTPPSGVQLDPKWIWSLVKNHQFSIFRLLLLLFSVAPFKK